MWTTSDQSSAQWHDFSEHRAYDSGQQASWNSGIYGYQDGHHQGLDPNFQSDLPPTSDDAFSATGFSMSLYQSTSSKFT